MTEDINGWTTRTLKEYIENSLREHDRRYEQRFAAQELAVSAAITAADRAVTKAELATEKRFDAVNEFRATLDGYTRTLMPRKEAEAQHAALVARLETLTTSFSDRMETGWATHRQQDDVRFDAADKRIETLLASMNAVAGRSSAYRETTQYSVYVFCAVIGVIAVIVAHFVR